MPGMPSVRQEELPAPGWYYKQDGRSAGPVSTDRLRELLTTGQLQPRQAVWKQGGHGLLFVHAVRAAWGSRSSLSELVSG
jgi:hypothetical protein